MATTTKSRTIFGEFTPVDFVFLAFIAIMAVISVINYDTVDLNHVLLNLGAMTLIIFFVNWLAFGSKSKWIRATHSFYIVPLAWFVFKTVEKISYPIHGHDFDPVLIRIDHAMFGTDPTIWLFHHFPIVPLFTEFMQFCYFTYYFLPVIVAIELFIHRHDHPNEDHSNDELEQFRFIVIYGLLASYICYLLMPGIGPRFTLHEFSNISNELPGLWITEPLRMLINAGENITSLMTSTEAAKVVTRDVFPSGHTEMTLLCILMAFKFRVRSRWFVLFFGTGLFFSTVYLRYHYAIDVIAGALLAIITLYTAEPVASFFRRIKKRYV